MRTINFDQTTSLNPSVQKTLTFQNCKKMKFERIQRTMKFNILFFILGIASIFQLCGKNLERQIFSSEKCYEKKLTNLII